MMKIRRTIVTAILLTGMLRAAEYHVSTAGDDGNEGSLTAPFQTISRAAEIARPGDVITVHEGVYRERINPPRGGTSDDQRIVYRAAPGEKVAIKGSEWITGWEKAGDDVWKVRLPNSFFGDFNPYSDLIQGDWYEARQPYHTGAVYVNGHWLKEASRKSVVVGADGAEGESKRELMNVEFLRVPRVTTVYASDASSHSGPMKDGDRLAFEGVDFGKGSTQLSLSTASPVGGGLVEIRKDTVEGELLGTLDAGLTAEWTHFQVFSAKLNQTLSGRQTIVLVFKDRPAAPAAASGAGFWFAEVDEEHTTIWAQFKGADPNQALVEINVRQTVFYPAETGRNYITVRGFTLEQAATPWSPPTAVQVGLIGTHWSKGWIIENNTIQYSACSGVTLGKHGDEFDNTYNYYRSIRVGLKKGWNRETIGSHLVRNNHIRHCGQGGIIGSLGPAFSTIIGNEIHDIRKNHQYGGCETAGIKLHGAVDVIIKDNHIYNCEHWGGIWLDWMGQGARVSGNLLHHNSNDLMVEMNHGPMLIDNNIFLSRGGLRDASGGGAYVHNLWMGNLTIWPELAHRRTPFFKPHSTDVIEGAAPPKAEFGAMGGAVAIFSAPVENTEQDTVYQTVRYGAKGYRLGVPNGACRVILKFNEPFYDAPGKRRFGATVQGKTVVDGLDLIAKAGKNQAVDVTAEDVPVEDGVLNIGLIRDLGAPCIAGVEVVGTRGEAEGFTLRINCGGKAWEGFKDDFVILPDAPRPALLDQPLTDRFGVTVDQHDDRHLNNLFAASVALSEYDKHKFEIEAAGNVYLSGEGRPSVRDREPLVEADFAPSAIRLQKKADGWWLKMTVDPAWRKKVSRALVTNELLGRATVPDVPFENRDGTPYRIDTDYFGEKRDADNPAPGPFRAGLSGKVSVKVWPRK